MCFPVAGTIMSRQTTRFLHQDSKKKRDHWSRSVATDYVWPQLWLCLLFLHYLWKCVCMQYVCLCTCMPRSIPVHTHERWFPSPSASTPSATLLPGPGLVFVVRLLHEDVTLKCKTCYSFTFVKYKNKHFLSICKTPLGINWCVLPEICFLENCTP